MRPGGGQATESTDPGRAALWEVVLALRAERRLREQRRVTQRLLLALTAGLVVTGCVLALIGKPYGAVLLGACALGGLSVQERHR